MLKVTPNSEPNSTQKKVNTVDFAKKLLGQIVFLYFLQKKGWFGVAREENWGFGSKNFLRELFNKKHGDYQNFFNDILEPLFYEALRLEHSGDYYSRFNCRIPFLNGGLFDPLGDYNWWNTDILLSDEFFSNDRKIKGGDTGNGVLDIFDRYNFTVKEDEPLEKEVAIDPEMLGKVFENLLEVKDRKSKGTYYTPREIVHYMCQESLANYLAAELEGKVSKEEIDVLIKHAEYVVEHESGVFNEGHETEKFAFNLSPSVRKHASFIDSSLASIRICDPAVGSGAFPVGMMNEIIRIRNTLTHYIGRSDERKPYHFKRQAIQNCIYGVDIDPGAVEIAKLRLWLSLIVDEEERDKIQPLPNLDFKIVQGNSLLSVEKDLFNTNLLNQLENLKQLYFNETSAGRKQEYRKKIDDLIKQITNGHEVFDFEVYFSEVFHTKKGFDIVIANPPYVKENVNRRAFDELRGSECYQGKMDLWYLFGCRGIDILKCNGTICFIATNNWVSNDGASKFRDKVVTQTRILDFIDFGGYKIFSAGIQTMVFIFRKTNKPTKYSVNYRKLVNAPTSMEVLQEFLWEKRESTVEYYTRYSASFDRSESIGKYISFTPPSIGQLLHHIKSTANFYLSDNEIFSGIDVNQNFVTKRHLDRLHGSFSIGDGVFILSDAEKKSIAWNKNELRLMKPYYTTKEVKRYYAKGKNRYWILYTGREVNIRIAEYPNIKNHLDKFQSIITSANRPYGLHRTRNETIFLGKKLLATRKCTRPTFSLVGFSSYFSRTFLAIKSEQINLKFLLAILNSRLIAFWLYHRGKLQGKLYQIDKNPLMSVPVLIPEENEQTMIIRLVDKILSNTNKHDYFENTSRQIEVHMHEKKIDQILYKLYGLTLEEIKIVESFNHLDY